MNDLIYSRAAQGDLQDIWSFVAQDNGVAAEALEQDVREAAERLLELPSLGHRRRDLTPHDLWFFNGEEKLPHCVSPEAAAGDRAHPPRCGGRGAGTGLNHCLTPGGQT